MNDADGYQAAAAKAREALAANPDLKELVRFATLAANSHNTQAWKFALQDKAIRIMADPRGRTPIVDPDDHHLIASLGCAAENLLLAAAANGRSGELTLSNIENGEVQINLAPSAPVPSALVQAIPDRQCTRSLFDGKEISAEQMKLLEAAARQDGVQSIFLMDPQKRERMLELILAANAIQMADKSFVSELNSWLRFNSVAALQAGDGLFSACSGNPQMPSWLGKPLFPLLFSEAAERDKIAAQMRSSAGVVVFVSAKDDKQHWFNAGRAYERFALQATALGIRNAHLNQPVEVPEKRKEVLALLGLADGRPDMIVRFGFAPAMPMSLRRPVEEVIV